MARLLPAESKDHRSSRDSHEFRPSVFPRDSAFAGLVRRWSRGSGGPAGTVSAMAATTVARAPVVLSRVSSGPRRMAIAVTCSLLLHALVISSVPEWRGELGTPPVAVIDVFIPEIATTTANQPSIPISRRFAPAAAPALPLAPEVPSQEGTTRQIEEATGPEMAKSAVVLPAGQPAQGATAVASYAQLLAALIAKHRVYPRLAALRRMQGQVEVQMRIGSEGVVTDASVSRTSGFEVLDRQALEMVKRAQP